MVVTTNILGDITRNIVGDEAEVTVLMQAGTDPHSFGVSAPQAASIEQADLVVYNGLGLEENVLRHVEAAEEAGVSTLAVRDAVDPITYTAGDSADEPDPHFWTDPERVRKAVGLIADQVTENVRGVKKAVVEKNASAYGAQVTELTAWMWKQFDEIPSDQRKLVTNHHVFGYLAQRFGFAKTMDKASGSAAAQVVDPIVTTYDGGLYVLDGKTLKLAKDIPLEGFNRVNPAGSDRHVMVSTATGFQVLDAAGR
ncbi:metal ABC transporter substrate-binding protein, partial [Streptomyces sp. NPDC088141]|uniref:metal ABC transporter substrate-binding protein n=1 Tax=Streptomyces sp. NPDC088141 TaxID=3155179 RepID=UPI0034437BE4